MGDLTGRLHGYPYMTAERDQLVVYSSADHTEDEPSASFLVSSDGGRALRKVAASVPAGRLGTVIGAAGIYVMGRYCAKPDRADDDCDPDRKDVVAYRIDPDTLEVHSLDPPRLEGEVSDAIRLPDGQPAFVVVTRHGPVEDEDLTTRLVALSGDGWRMSSLPTDTFHLCAVDGVTVAFAHELADQDKPVVKGGVIWKAYASDDGGSTWSDPIPYRSQLRYDYSSSPTTSCGSRGVAVMSAQLGVFDVHKRAWASVLLPKTVGRPSAPPVIWNGDDALSYWVTARKLDGTEPDGFRSVLQQVVVSDLWDRPVARAQAPESSDDSVVTGQGPGADRDGFAVVSSDDQVTLVKAKRA